MICRPALVVQITLTNTAFRQPLVGFRCSDFWTLSRLLDTRENTVQCSPGPSRAEHSKSQCSNKTLCWPHLWSANYADQESKVFLSNPIIIFLHFLHETTFGESSWGNLYIQGLRPITQPRCCLKGVHISPTSFMTHNLVCVYLGQPHSWPP